MRQREIKIFDITIGSVGEVRRLFATNLPGVPVRVTSRPQCFTMAAGDATIRRGTVLLYNRERRFWVQYRTIYDAIAGIRHAQRGYGMSGDFPRTELARLDSMLLNLEGAREIMLGYRTMTEEQRNRAALRLVQAADEYRMPRVEKKVRARAWLARAALQMLPADEPHPGSGHGRNPGAALLALRNAGLIHKNAFAVPATAVGFIADSCHSDGVWLRVESDRVPEANIQFTAPVL